MKIKFLKPLAFAAALSTMLTGCINDDDYATPVNACVEPALTANKTVAQVIAASTPVIQLYAGEDVIEAYVNSSDERGNFFKIVYLQTLPTDGTAPVGISVAVDKTTLFGANLYPGRKVYVNLKGLDYQMINGALALGRKYQTNEGETPALYAIGRIPESEYAQYVQPSCNEVGEDQLVRTMTIAQAATDANLNTLIELTGVQFADEFVGGKYFDKDDTENTRGGATNRFLVDLNGGSIALRTSSFANFSGNIIPENSGKVRGVITKYNGAYQFVARAETDIKLDQPRMVVVIDPNEPSPSAMGGTAITYPGSLTEGFETYAVGVNAFPPYVNDNSVGTRYWAVKQFPTTPGGNRFIEMTSFAGSGAPGVATASQLFVPVDFGPANTLSFDKEIRYMAGECLKVYYVTDLNYTPGNTYDVSTFQDITAEFTNLIYPENGASQFSFTTAGTYNIPTGLTGHGYFVFEYTGTTTVTTTFQLDNITIN